MLYVCLCVPYGAAVRHIGIVLDTDIRFMCYSGHQLQ